VEQAFTKPNDLPHLIFSGCRHSNAALALISGINPKAGNKILVSRNI
jgi:hypothetical protein